MSEYYIPGLGIVEVEAPGDLFVKATLDDVEAVGTRIEHMPFCGGCGQEDGERLEGDYICVACREREGDITLDAELSEYTGKVYLPPRNPNQLRFGGLDTR